MKKSQSYINEIKAILRLHAAWLTKRPGGKQADFAYFDLSEMNLSEINLSKAILVGASLTKSLMRKINLSEADLFAADLEGADLSGANLFGAVLRGACLNDANLSGANLTGADLRGGDGAADQRHEKVQRFDARTGEFTNATELIDANLASASLVDTQLQRCDLTGADLESCDFSGADLSDAILVAANLGDDLNFGADDRRANLANAVFDVAGVKALHARGVSVDSSYKDARPVIAKLLELHQQWAASNGKTGRRMVLNLVDLEGVALTGAQLAGAKVTRSNLRGVDLTNADLSLSDLSYCDLMGAKLTDANISGATLRRANLSDCNLSGATALTMSIVGKSNRPWPTNFQRALLARADLRLGKTNGALFHSVDLSTTRLGLTVLRGGNFAGATLPASVTEDKLREIQKDRQFERS